MEFKIEEIYDKQDMIALTRAAMLRRRRKSKRSAFLQVLGIIASIGFLLGGILELIYFVLVSIRGPIQQSIAVYGSVVASILASMVFMFAIGFLLLFRYCSPILGWFTWRNYKEKGMTVNYHFGEEDFLTHTPIVDQRCDYAVIEEAVEDKKRYFLYIGNSTAYLLRKDSFTSGDPEQFRDFIAGKLGKEVKQI